jgi:hypothetical protein
MAADRFADLQARELPAPPRLWAALGPGVVWMALAQGTGELYFWPYFAAKYGALYLCLLVPACLLQTPINVEIGRYTVLTGESVFVGFTRLHRGFGLFMWIYFAVNFVFIGSFAMAGGTALADIIPWPGGLDVRGPIPWEIVADVGGLAPRESFRGRAEVGVGDLPVGAGGAKPLEHDFRL